MDSIGISIGIESLDLESISISIGIEFLTPDSISIVSVSKKLVSKVSEIKQKTIEFVAKPGEYLLTPNWCSVVGTGDVG